MTVTLDRPVADDTAAQLHDDKLRQLLALETDMDRAAGATAYINWLDACRNEASVIREISVYRMHSEQKLGALRIANGIGVARARAQQIIYRSAEGHAAAAQAVAKIRRRLSRS